MKIDQQLRRRADQLREQLKETMRQTRDAITNTKKLTDPGLGCPKRQSYGRNVVRTIENVRSARERLDAPRPR